MTNLYKNNLKISIAVGGCVLSGKSSLVQRYVSGQFVKDTPHSAIDIHAYAKVLKLEDKTMIIHIFDTVGSIGLKKALNQNLDYIIVCYDLYTPETLDNVKEIISGLHNFGGQIIICGTKCDSAVVSELTTRQEKIANCFEDDMKLEYFETSALNGSGVDELFNFIVDDFIKRVNNDKQEIEEVIKNDEVVTKVATEVVSSDDNPRKSWIPCKNCVLQ